MILRANFLVLLFIGLHHRGTYSQRQIQNTNTKRESSSHQQSPPPVVFDTDYGSFVDDVFALGLLLNSNDVLDLRYVITTSEEPHLSSKCVAKHVHLSGNSIANNTTVDGNIARNIRVGVGSTLPPFSERGSVCGVPGLIGFALEDECKKEEPGLDLSRHIDEDGIASVAEMILSSDRDDWIYIVVGGQTSIRNIIEEYPSISSKISTIIIMGGNFCSNFEPFVNVYAPTDETNVGCDIKSANYISSSNFGGDIYYVPVENADTIHDNDYREVVEAASPEIDGTSGIEFNKAANATIEFYYSWSEATRKDENLLAYEEAWKYNPKVETAVQYDATAIMLAIELVKQQTSNFTTRMDIFTVESGVHFVEKEEGNQTTEVTKGHYPGTPRPAYSILPVDFQIEKENLPAECPGLTPYTFSTDAHYQNMENTNPVLPSKKKRSVKIAFGYKSLEAKVSLYAEMALRMAGVSTKGTTNKSEDEKEEEEDEDIVFVDNETISPSLNTMLRDEQKVVRVENTTEDMCHVNYHKHKSFNYAAKNELLSITSSTWVATGTTTFSMVDLYE